MTFDELISTLTLEEKAALLGGADAWNTAAIERVGIPSICVSDGPHGLRKLVETKDSPDMSESRQAICFPSGATLASSFDPELIEQLGETLGNECNAEGVDIILGPAVNIKRSPLCGRNFEYFSEDPFLAGTLAAAYVKGVQSKGVGVSVKHFAANNQERRRMSISAVIDDRALREIYLSAFERIVKEAKPDTLMCSYNKINGVYSSENPVLLNKILRDEWGFDGFVMSDWGAVCDRAKGVAAGLDLEMPTSNGINQKKIVDAVLDGKLDEALLDKAVKNVLRIVDKHTDFMKKLNGEAVDSKVKPKFNYVEDHKTARKIARESMVLLKNDGVLPLKKDDRILFVGEFAKVPRIQGGGSSHINATRVISALEASKRHTNVEYAKGFSSKRDLSEDNLIDEAVEAAKHADTVVIFAGLPDVFESEGYDREHMRLPSCQNKLIREITKVAANTVVVLHNGSPVSMPWIGSVGAVLEAYLGGEACGEAVTDILFGVVNPCGKLAESFPFSVKDTPCYDNFPGNQLTVEYRESIFVGYRYYDKVNANVLFPFGHGLSYTTFEYSDISVTEQPDRVNVSFKVKNTGEYRGKEVAQVYVGKNGSRVFRAVKELKGFKKIMLEPGEERLLSFELDDRAFSYYSVGVGRWVVEPGEYTISVGSSSRDIRLRETVSIDREDHDIRLKYGEELPTYFFGDPSSVPDEEFETLLMAEIPQSFRSRHERITIDNTLEDAKDSKWGGRVNGILTAIMKGKNLLNGGPEIMSAGMLETPIHTMMCMSGGKLTEEMTARLVELLNDENVTDNLKYFADIKFAEVKDKLGKATEGFTQTAKEVGNKAVDFIKSRIK